MQKYEVAASGDLAGRGRREHVDFHYAASDGKANEHPVRGVHGSGDFAEVTWQFYAPGG